MKKYFVVAGARLKCDQTIAPAPGVFMALNPLWNIRGKGVGRVTDFIPLFNVMSFGVPCKMLTQAAAGVPVPCVPFPTPWQGTHDSGRGTMLPVLLDSSTCRCVFGGGISVSSAGQTIVSYDGPVAPAPAAPPLPANIVVYRPADQHVAADQQAHAQQLADAETQLNRPATLPPNTLFLVNNYLYVTDDQGKVVQAKGVLELETAGRVPYAQKESVPHKDGQAVTAAERATQPATFRRRYWDDGGHIFGSRFNGTGLHINYVPMHRNQNQPNVNGGNWFAMEERQAKALEEGKHVYAEYEFEYPPEEPNTKKYGGYKKTSKRDFSVRPATLNTSVWVDGRRTNKPYPNT